MSSPSLANCTSRPSAPSACSSGWSARAADAVWSRSPAVRRGARVDPGRSRVRGANSRIAAACGGILFLQDVTDCPRPFRRASRAWRATAKCESTVSRYGHRHPLDGERAHAPGIEGEVQVGTLSRRPATGGSPRPASICRRSRDRRRRRERCWPPTARGVVRRGRMRAARVHAVGAGVVVGAHLAGQSRRASARRRTRGDGNPAHDTIRSRTCSRRSSSTAPTRETAPAAPFVPAGNLRDARLRFERDYIAAVLQHHGWRMARPHRRSASNVPISIGRRVNWGFRWRGPPSNVYAPLMNGTAL